MSNFIVNSFQVPNSLVDDLICSISGNELKCYLVIVRKTKGWQKSEDAISLSQFELLTKLSRSVIINCCKSLEEKGLIESKKGYRNTTVYWLKNSTSEESELVNNSNQSLVKNLNRSSEESELVTSEESEHTKDTIKKQYTKDNKKINKKESFDPVSVKPKNLSIETWLTWIDYRTAKKQKLHPKTWIAQSKMLEQQPDPEAVINLSIMNGWQGLFPEKAPLQKVNKVNQISNGPSNPTGFRVVNA